MDGPGGIQAGEQQPLTNWNGGKLKIDSKLLQLETDCFNVDDPEASDKDKGKETSIYGSILPLMSMTNRDRFDRDDQSAKPAGSDVFVYRTLDGQVIKSVQPPGKGKRVNYKVCVGVDA